MSEIASLVSTIIGKVEHGVGVDDRDLALLLLYWEEKKRRLNRLEALITDAILQKEETVVVGYAQAKYSEGRTTYDYEEPLSIFAPDYIDDSYEEAHDRHTEMIEKTNWKAICEDLGIKPSVKKEPTPSVSITLLEEK